MRRYGEVGRFHMDGGIADFTFMVIAPHEPVFGKFRKSTMGDFLRVVLLEIDGPLTYLGRMMCVGDMGPVEDSEHITWWDQWPE